MAFITFKWHKNRTFVEDRLPVTGLFFQRKAFMSETQVYSYYVKRKLFAGEVGLYFWHCYKITECPIYIFVPFDSLIKLVSCS